MNSFKNQEQNPEGHLPYEGHEVILALIKFKEKLEHIAEYSHNPLPGLCTQAVHFVYWSFLIFGAMNFEPKNFDGLGPVGIFFVSTSDKFLRKDPFTAQCATIEFSTLLANWPELAVLASTALLRPIC